MTEKILFAFLYTTLFRLLSLDFLSLSPDLRFFLNKHRAHLRGELELLCFKYKSLDPRFHLEISSQINLTFDIELGVIGRESQLVAHFQIMFFLSIKTKPEATVTSRVISNYRLYIK